MCLGEGDSFGGGDTSESEACQRQTQKTISADTVRQAAEYERDKPPRSMAYLSDQRSAPHSLVGGVSGAIDKAKMTLHLEEPARWFEPQKRSASQSSPIRFCKASPSFWDMRDGYRRKQNDLPTIHFHRLRAALALSIKREGHSPHRQRDQPSYLVCGGAAT